MIAEDTHQADAPLTFWRSPAPEPHAARTKAILTIHPEVRRLLGRNPWTAAIAAVAVIFQLMVAVVFGKLGMTYWPLILAAAWCVGAFANHCLYVVIHEATHDLIFRARFWNKVAALVSDLPNLLPGAIAFRAYHLQHHSHLGVLAVDADLPSRWEIRMVGNGSFSKTIWLLMFPLAQALRPLRVGASNLSDRWFIANAACNAAIAVALVLSSGWASLLYLFASFWFSIGLHPLGARWIQEHFTLDPRQETSSYYGPLNVPALNVGYHNEHHDFPSIPWNRLPDLERTAPEFYRNLSICRSWSGLLWRFLSDPRYSLASRVTRDEHVPRAPTERRLEPV